MQCIFKVLNYAIVWLGELKKGETFLLQNLLITIPVGYSACRSVYRANPHNDAERPASVIVRPGAHPPPPPYSPRGNPNADRPMSVVGRYTCDLPALPPEVKRVPSFRPVDISSPKLQSSTNHKIVHSIALPRTKSSPMPDDSRTGTGHAVAVAANGEVKQLVPSRTAPVPPGTADGARLLLPGGDPDAVVDPRRKAPKRPPLPQGVNKAPVKEPAPERATTAKVTQSAATVFSGEQEQRGHSGGGYEEIALNSPTCPPPDPPDSRHRFYSCRPASGVGGEMHRSSDVSRTPAASNSKRRSAPHLKHRLQEPVACCPDLNASKDCSGSKGPIRPPVEKPRNSPARAASSAASVPKHHVIVRGGGLSSSSMIAQETSVGGVHRPPVASSLQENMPTNSALAVGGSDATSSDDGKKPALPPKPPLSLPSSKATAAGAGTSRLRAACPTINESQC